MSFACVVFYRWSSGSTHRTSVCPHVWTLSNDAHVQIIIICDKNHHGIYLSTYISPCMPYYLYSNVIMSLSLLAHKVMLYNISLFTLIKSSSGHICRKVECLIFPPQQQPCELVWHFSHKVYTKRLTTAMSIFDIYLFCSAGQIANSFSA